MHKREKIDRLNKDIEPPQKEGYLLLFTSTGWQYKKILNAEQIAERKAKLLKNRMSHVQPKLQEQKVEQQKVEQQNVEQQNVEQQNVEELTPPKAPSEEPFEQTVKELISELEQVKLERVNNKKKQQIEDYKKQIEEERKQLLEEQGRKEEVVKRPARRADSDNPLLRSMGF